MIWYIHWNESELGDRVQSLRSLGYAVSGHGKPGISVRLTNPLPDALIISLDRLPSHGRAIAEWFHESQERAAIPLIFAGGNAARIAEFQARFPNARFCNPDEIGRVLSELSLPAAS